MSPTIASIPRPFPSIHARCCEGSYRCCCCWHCHDSHSLFIICPSCHRSRIRHHIHCRIWHWWRLLSRCWWLLLLLSLSLCCALYLSACSCHLVALSSCFFFMVFCCVVILYVDCHHHPSQLTCCRPQPVFRLSTLSVLLPGAFCWREFFFYLQHCGFCQTFVVIYQLPVIMYILSLRIVCVRPWLSMHHVSCCVHPFASGHSCCCLCTNTSAKADPLKLRFSTIPRSAFIHTLCV